jgi:hypothetical protein
MSPLQTTEILGVPILAVGRFKGIGSPPEGDDFTLQDLQNIARANNTLADEVRVPVKIGHSQAQRLLRNTGLYADEMPAAGWLTNFRVEGDKLLTDLKAVPAKLAQVVKSGAFPGRSVELVGPVKSQRDGRVFGAVVSALALLGAKAPAVRTLDDVIALYSTDGEPTREVRGLDGKVHVLPLSEADAMEGALANVSGYANVGEDTYAAYAARSGVWQYRPQGYMRSLGT